MTPDSILARMDAALEKARARKIDPNVFYLTAEDWDAYNAEFSAEYGSTCFRFQHDGVEIRRGKQSRLYGTRGECVWIPVARPPSKRVRKPRPAKRERAIA